MFFQTFIGFLVLDFLYLTAGFNLDYKQASIIKGRQGTPNSYFGYSIAILDEDNVFIGSPRENDTHMVDIDRPGVVYKCHFTTEWACQALDIDHNTGKEKVGSYKFKHGKNNQWLGATILTPSIDHSKGIVTCAPRWYDRSREDISAEIYMRGICYRMPLDFTYDNIDKMFSRKERKRKRNFPKELDVYHYGSSQMGMSGHFTKEDKSLIIGLPGVDMLTGSFVNIPHSDPDRWNYMEIPAKNVEAADSYYGYAVTSGVYFGDGIEYYVTGAPRAGLTGKVIGFRSTIDKFKLKSPTFELQGEGPDGEELPFNSYYGAALCSVDVNNDGIDDLLVGAPLFSYLDGKSGDVGLVLLYLGTSTDTVGFNKTSEVLQGDMAYDGRFGTAIASLGDMNTDKYNDVAVGAPYAEDMRGAIYIFNGYKNGLWNKFSQKITASSISHSLMGFGHSFSNVFDLDRDGINDIIVGAYLSDKAVVISGQPVIKIKATLTVNVNNVPQSVIRYNETEAYVQVCFEFDSKACSKIQIMTKVTLDKERKGNERVFFQDNRTPNNILTVDVFKDDGVTCTSMREGKILVDHSTNDLVTPIFVETDYEMKSNVCPGTTRQPVINKFDGDNPKNLSLKLTQVISFKKDCPNNECQTDLHLTMTPIFMPKSSYFIIGQTRLDLFVNITKTRDPSYGSIFQLSFSDYVRFRQSTTFSGSENIVCSIIENNDVITDVLVVSDTLSNWVVNGSTNETMLHCPYGNPMHDSGVSFKISLQIPDNIHVSEIVFIGTAFTHSSELVPDDNRVTLKVPVRNQVKGLLTGVAKLLDDIGGDQIFQHTYVFVNHGPSPLPSAEMKVYFPQMQVDGRAILYLNSINVVCGHYCTVECNVDEAYEGHLFKSEVNGRLDIHTADRELPNLETYDCSKQTCSAYTCAVTNMAANVDVRVKLEFILDNELFQVSKKDMKFISKATINLLGSNLIADKTKLEYQLEQDIQLKHEEKPKQIKKDMPIKEKVPWWIVFLSVIGGILIYLIIVLILYKCGFFKRHRPVRPVATNDQSGKEGIDTSADSKKGAPEKGGEQ